MTYDYGRRDATRGPGEPWGQRTAPPGSDASRHGDIPRPRTDIRPGDQPRPPVSPAPQIPPGGYGVPGRRPAGDVDQWGTPTRGAGFPEGPGGNSGTAPREPERHGPEPETGRRSRKPLVLLLLLALVAGAGGGWYYLRNSAEQPLTEQERRIEDRNADPAPLTIDQIFPAGTVDGAGGPYKVLKTQESAKCDTAASGAVAEALATAGCTQVVRATLASPDSALVITAGVFNLESRTKTEKAAAAIKEAVDAGTGRFGGLVAGGSSDIVSRAAANLAWEVRGHYLVYGVVANADGSAITEKDTRTDTVRADLVEKHLGGVVVNDREAAGTSAPEPSGRPS
ncbi:hypothetical protein [Actinoplanes sp. NPDC049802]|uniref:hypothetical protein n=1 Tax=Actinoplanes sp. NPDC049802 TaxID=3154742 RepID=UPI0033DD0944